MRKRLSFALIPLAVFAAGVFLLRSAGRLLVVDRPVRSDVIVVLDGDRNDRRYHRGLELLEEGYGRLMLVDARADSIQFGRSMADSARDFVQRSAGGKSKRVQVCPIEANSTDEETTSVARCLAGVDARTVLLVTSDFHTHRALSVFRRRLPPWEWSAAASRDGSVFGIQWWRHREWAKTALLEWTKWGWWILIDRWKSGRRPSV